MSDVTVTQAVLGFAALAVVLTVIPGLDSTLVLRSALVHGRRRALATALGICVGALAWGTAAAVGAAALLAASELAYRIVTLAGALYMASLGVTMIIKSFRGSAQGIDLGQVGAPIAPWRSFATGAWTNLLNPKVGVFYIATIPQFIPPDTSQLGMGLLLAGVHDAISLVWFALIITAASVARRWLASARSLRIIDRVAGTVLVGFGAKLALDHRV